MHLRKLDLKDQERVVEWLRGLAVFAPGVVVAEPAHNAKKLIPLKYRYILCLRHPKIPLSGGRLPETIKDA